MRHLAEYVSLDAELGFITDHRDVLSVLRDAIAGMVTEIRASAGEEAELVAARLPQVPEEIPIVHFREALRLVGAHPEEPDLAPEHKRHLGQWAKETFESDFVAVEGYPAKKRPFYTYPQPDDPYWTNSFDLIFRGLELVTGGQRLHEYADYQHALAQRAEPTQPYESYLQTFRHGMPPHGGFAIGLERWTAISPVGPAPTTITDIPGTLLYVARGVCTSGALCVARFPGAGGGRTRISRSGWGGCAPGRRSDKPACSAYAVRTSR